MGMYHCQTVYRKMADDPFSFLLIIKKYVLSGLSSAYFQNKMSVKQSLKYERDSCTLILIVKVICKHVCHQHTRDD